MSPLELITQCDNEDTLATEGTAKKNSPIVEKDVAQEKSYWKSFYSNFSLAIPSQFCVLTATEVDKVSQPIVEFGCGNARDSIYLANQGFNVFATDLSAEVISKNQTKTPCAGSVEFVSVDATNEEQVKSIIDKARAAKATGSLVVYSRFFLHSIDEDQENLFIEALAKALVAGDEIHSEYRSKEDESLPKVYGKSHYRRYIDTPALLQKLQGKGFDVVYEITGRGMAKYKNEDPFVSRFIVRKLA
eukprot:CAMPEP_0194371994 /NCGR_PEP_ID=MMETSP0174-20130528/20302_1 /TAXON_ID=216777 /ORGANISM="Proboscia alata, Strain PI-D3" /LENGTH=245 /DNA_ID=CAMNT_0039150249 /DNA_START=138 /DNA_END=875 /DNA_ORIENTATION=+